MSQPQSLGAGRYELGEALGGSSLAMVYRAYDTHLQRWRAVKVPKDTPAAARRFEQEAKTVAMLEHRHIVRVFDVGRDAHFLVMELVEGGSLAHWVAKNGAMPLGMAVDVIQEVAEGVASAHARGVYHGHLAPGDVLITLDGVCRVADFGVPGGSGSDASAFRAPELEAGGSASAAADVYALGAMLAWLCTAGARPLDDPHVGPVVAQAMLRDPARRHPSVRGFIEALEAVRWDLPEVPDGAPEFGALTADVARDLVLPQLSRPEVVVADRVGADAAPAAPAPAPEPPPAESGQSSSSGGAVPASRQTQGQPAPLHVPKKKKRKKKAQKPVEEPAGASWMVPAIIMMLVVGGLLGGSAVGVSWYRSSQNSTEEAAGAPTTPTAPTAPTRDDRSSAPAAHDTGKAVVPAIDVGGGQVPKRDAEDLDPPVDEPEPSTASAEPEVRSCVSVEEPATVKPGSHALFRVSLCERASEPVTLFYRPVGGGSWSQAAMPMALGAHTAKVPIDDAYASGLEYYVVARDGAAGSAATPRRIGG